MQPRHFARYRPAKAAIPKNESGQYDFPKIVPVISAALIFLGISRLIFYYSLYHVNIVSYLDFSEILTSFLDALWALVFAIIGALFLALFMGLANSYRKKVDAPELKQQRKKRQKIANWIWLISFIFYYGYLWVSAIKTDFYELPILLGISIILVLIGVLISKHPEDSIKETFYWLLFFLFIESLVLMITWIEFKSTTRLHSTIGTTIIFDEKTFVKDSSHIFISDSTTFYIGKTRNYLFVYDSKKEATTVFPMSSVIQMINSYK